ncbi:hypothetical protein [Metabacillus sp. 84]|uniref:hypothetical protein n=1 Tax=Metabacillus sp. 84 TaxID=3404705 RepID=UPI003CEE29DC
MLNKVKFNEMMLSNQKERIEEVKWMSWKAKQLKGFHGVVDLLKQPNWQQELGDILTFLSLNKIVHGTAYLKINCHYDECKD